MLKGRIGSEKKRGQVTFLEKEKGGESQFAARGGPLTFQRNGVVTPGHMAATWPNEMVAAGNIS